MVCLPRQHQSMGKIVADWWQYEHFWFDNGLMGFTEMKRSQNMYYKETLTELVHWFGHKKSWNGHRGTSGVMRELLWQYDCIKEILCEDNTILWISKIMFVCFSEIDRNSVRWCFIKLLWRLQSKTSSSSSFGWNIRISPQDFRVHQFPIAFV